MPAYDFGFVSLDILWVNSNDSGVYSCRASNGYGEDIVSAVVKCKGRCLSAVTLFNIVNKTWNKKTLSCHYFNVSFIVAMDFII